MAQFKVNTQRFDPYKNFKFRVKWDGKYVAGISKCSSLKRTTEVVKHREGGDPSSTRKSPGRTEYEAITLERGVTWERLTAAAEKDMEFLEVCYPVGQSVPEAEHAIQHTGQEYAVIIEGALSTQIGFEQYVLEEGDSLTFDSAIPHRFWNAGTVPARAIWVILNRSR